MPYYRRATVPEGTYFFTLVTQGRAPILCTDRARTILGNAFRECLRKRPFDAEAMVLLPDHQHLIWKLPEGDSDFSGRVAAVKASFTHQWLQNGGAERDRSQSRRRHRSRGIWQPRFWEHWIRDKDDLAKHLDYVHYNPVKHGLVQCPHAWPYSTFRKWVKRGVYELTWNCVCDGRKPPPPTFDGMADYDME